MGTDFFDDDLLRTDKAPEETVQDDHDVPVRPITETGLNRMARQKKEISEHVAGTMDEIERLRQRQELLEKEKQNLRELSRKQEEYETGKSDIIEKLSRSVLLVEKEETQAERMVELLGETRSRFNGMLSELRNIDEEAWGEEGFETELNRAMVMVEIARSDYKKSLAKIDAAGWHKSAAGRNQVAAVPEPVRGEVPNKDFSFWLKVGLGASLPLILVIVLMFVVFLVLSSQSLL